MESSTPRLASPFKASGPPRLPQEDSSASAHRQASSSPQSHSDGSSGNISDGGNMGGSDDIGLPSSSSDAADSSVLRHPKGRRKRTAAKDKAILEGAYLANPKPDKAARLDIVSQVSLNEKEVQIWFQNRRQNDRRKSRPLSPQEIAALRYGGAYALSSDPPPPFMHSLPHPPPYSDAAVSSSPPQHMQFTSASMVSAAPSTTPLSSPDLGPWTPEALARKRAERKMQPCQPLDSDAAEQSRASAQTPLGARSSLESVPSSASQSFASSTGSMSSVGYLANRWNMHSSFSSSPASGKDLAHSEPSAPFSAPPVLPPPSAHEQQRQQHHSGHHRPFRLSMSLDGKAEIISGLSPSPPRLPPPQPITAFGGRRSSGGSARSSNARDGALPALPAIRRPGLSRSHSALPSFGLTLPPISSLTSGSSFASSSSSTSSTSITTAAQPLARPPRLLRGRSRDVHAWEYVCDAETRVDDELSAQAQHEASGSATAAISLLRSASAMSSSGNSSSSHGVLHHGSPGVLQPNGNKRNAPSRGITAPRPNAKRAKLGRASSSVARMQTVPHAVQDVVGGKGTVAAAADDNGDGDDDQKKKKLKLSTLLSGNDSDKENWSPDEDGGRTMMAPFPRIGGGSHSNRGGGRSNGHGRRPLPSGVLGDVGNKQALGLRATGGGGKPSASSPDSLDVYEDRSGGENSPRPVMKRAPPLLSRAATLPGADEVVRFMRGADVSPSKKGDLDCVAGLLSLSQGNWR